MRAAARTIWAVLLGAAGAAAFAFGLWSTLRHLHLPIGPYDEGLLLTDSSLLLRGELPYRDFYVNYPPGVFHAIGALWRLFGTSVLVERLFGLAVHVILALAAGRLAGRLAQRRFSPLAAGLTMTWLSPLGVIPYAYLAGILGLTLSLELQALAGERGSRALWLAFGAVATWASWFRHDLFLFFAVSAVAGLAIWTWRARAWRSPDARSAALWCAIGSLAALAVTWLPLFISVGFRQVADDLYFDQVRYVMPARVLPFPRLIGPHPGSVLPLFLKHFYPGSVVLSFVGPPAAGLLLGLSASRHRALPVLMIALALAVLPQMLGRSDFVHVLYAVTPPIVVLCAFVEIAPRGRTLARRAASLALAAAALVLLVAPALSMLPAKWELDPLAGRGVSYPMSRAAGARDPDTGLVAARMRILEEFDRRTRPGDPLYVGLLDHRIPFVSEMDLYFLFDRPGSTRYMQFDPNVVSREDVQRGMAAEIDRLATPALVLSRRFNGSDEPNDSRKRGATFLDRWIRWRYLRAASAGPYELWIRQPDAPAAAPPHR